MKYINYEITFAEVPDEISLCINISNCKFKCKGCHSPWLWEDTGEKLTPFKLYELLKNNKGISCVCFMGGELPDILFFSMGVKFFNKNLKVAWYTGSKDIPKNLRWFDYIKIGPYIEELGGLDNPNTNQRFYKVCDNTLEDITYKFWKNVSQDSTQ